MSNLIAVESVRIRIESPLQDLLCYEVDDKADDLYFTDEDFVMEWLPRVSVHLKLLSITNFRAQVFQGFQTNVLPLVSLYCHNLVELEVKYAWLSMENLNPMPMLTSLTLEYIKLNDEELNELTKCFPNLQVFNLIRVVGLDYAKIELDNVKTCHWMVSDAPSYLSLLTPNLTTLRLECRWPAALFIDAPMLSHFHLALTSATAFVVTKYQKLTTVYINSLDIGYILYSYLLTNTVENLTIDSPNLPRGDVGNSKFDPEKVFTFFPNVRSLCIESIAWSKFEASYNTIGWETWNGSKGFKTFCAYLLLIDPSLTFSCVDCVLNLSMDLSEVSLLIHRDVSFISKCMTRWPGLKWSWGMWREGMEDSWFRHWFGTIKVSRRKSGGR